MLVEADCIEDESSRPDINSLVDRKVGPSVEHLRGSVHWGAVFCQLILKDGSLVHVPVGTRRVNRCGG